MSGRLAGELPDSQRALALLMALVALTAASNLTTAFGLPLALAKLCLGLLNLALIGAVCARILGLHRPRFLATAWYILLAQGICILYVYLRSALSLYTGLAGISLPEVVVAEALLFTHFARRHGLPRLIGRAPRLDLACHGLWLGGLLALALQKLDLLYTPSSDPDIHAYYARQILEGGRLFYDLLPGSDVPVTYAGGFAAMNLVLGRLSGLHPVQLVNLQPYLQYTIFMGCGFSLMAGHLRRQHLVLLFGALYFAASALVFNPLFVSGRAHLEGTPRLSHTALLFFPLFFLLWNGNRAARRPLLLLLPLSAVMIGVCTNPAHAPASLLLAAIAAGLALGRWRASTTRISATRRGWIVSALAGLALALLFLAIDPFYRDAAGLGGARDPALDTASNALALQLGAAQIAGALRAVATESLLPWQGPGLPSTLPLVLWSAGLLCILVALLAVAPPGRSLRLSPAEKRLLALFGGAALFLALHGLWCESIPSLVRIEHVAGRLLVQYSWGAQRQAGLLFFALLVPLPLLLAFGRLDRLLGPGSRGYGSLPARAAALAIALVVGLAALPLLRLAVPRIETFVPELRATPLGEVHPDDLRIAEIARVQVGDEERVLLPGRLFDKSYERWVLPTYGARAIPHFTPLRTAFFAGLDGVAFTAEAYRQHVRRSFDAEWLRGHRVVWLFESGDIPQTLLERHYERVARGERSSLWKLREATRNQEEKVIAP